MANFRNYNLNGRGKAMEYSFGTHGICARQIIIDVDEDSEIVNNVKFVGGCSGNTQGVAALVRGRKIDEVVGLLKGIDCNYKGTSCPDQLACALEQIKSEI